MFDSNDSDTIEVREDERFDESRLAEYLKDRLPGADQPLTVRQFGGGAANLTYELDYGTHRYVLRRPPLGPVAEGSHDMGREYKVLSVLYKALRQAPRAYLFCDDEAVIGAPFLIMERLDGVVVRRRMPEAFAGMADAPRRMSEALIDTLADFHTVDYEAIGLGELGKPAGFVERQIEGWYRRWHRAKDHEIPEMDRAYEWLKANVPPEAAHTLVHNDYKLDNCMFERGDPGYLKAVFDWDMCTLGDPLCDLGQLLTYWTEPGDSDEYKAITPMPTDVEGWLSRKELVRRYAERSGIGVGHITFYHVLGIYRLAVILQQIYIRWLRGQTQDQRFEALGPLVPLCAQQAEQMSREGSPAEQ